jgi:hypothetical protein
MTEGIDGSFRYPKPAYLAAIGALVRPSIRSRRDPRKPQCFPAAWTSRLRQPEDARGDVGRNVLDIRRIHPIRLNNRIGKPAGDEADDARVVRMGAPSRAMRYNLTHAYPDHLSHLPPHWRGFRGVASSRTLLFILW